MSTVNSSPDAPVRSAPGQSDKSNNEAPTPNAAAQTNNDGETSQGDEVAKAQDAHATPPSVAPEETLGAKALHFAATATTGTLAGIAVGFSAVAYTLLGRVGLVLIGAVGGVLAFIAWEARNPEVSRAVRGERGIDILERLHLANKISESAENNIDEDEEQITLKDLEEFRPETKEALGGLIDAVIRDYVKWWYNPIIPHDHAFPLAVRKTLTSYLLAISNHLYRKRPADAFLDLLTNSSSIIIVFMSELAAAFAEQAPDNNLSAVDTIYMYLADHPDSNLANLLNNNQQASKFKMVAEDLLQYLDRNSHNCDPARIFLREIISTTVLESTLQRCSKADWINGWIVYLLESGEPDLNQAIDVGMQTGRDATANVFADMDGNVGNVGIAKPGRSSTDGGSARRKDSVQSHKKKLSKADEEMEVAMEEMKKLNALIAEDDQRRHRASTIRNSTDKPPSDMADAESHKKSLSSGESSVLSNPSTNGTSPPGTSTDGVSTKSEAVPTPITPRSAAGAPSPETSPQQPRRRFTSFDQIAPPVPADEAEDNTPQPAKAPLTLHNASFTLHDDANGDNARIRNKPNWDYLIQVEPSSSEYPGWMIVRRYSDFETLHEILRRIAAISGATAFTELHKELPGWKVHTRESLRGELERYLRDACWYHSLAESEGMKRFLEKSQGHTHTDSKSFGWDSVGKNMLDALTIAPKGAMEGGKQIVGGVQGVFGNFPGLSRKSTNQSVDLTVNANRLSLSTPPRMDNPRSPARSERASMDSERSSVISTQPGKMPPMERRPSYESRSGDADHEAYRMGRTERIHSASGPASGRPSREHSRTSSLAPTRSPSSLSLENIKLPPHPDEIPDDYVYSPGNDLHMKASESCPNLDMRNMSISPGTSTFPTSATAKKPAPKPPKQYSQLSEGETRVAVELIFAVINEMYTLSSAWNIRRTLLTAAKSFLLRPGNPSLLTVQSLIQSSVLDSQTSDAGIATQLRKLRENSMPTEAELAAWPAELSAEEKEKLRVRARQLLIKSGVPAALMGVMGQAATSEALGRVFDCLQIEEVARGLIFGLILQAVRLVTH